MARCRAACHCVVVDVLGMLGVAVPEVVLPVLSAAVPPAVPPAPIEVPAPVAPLEAVESVLPVAPVVPEPDMLPLAPAVVLLSDGEVVVDGVVVEVEDAELAPVSSFFLPQAVRDRAAIRARAAHCAIGDLIIRNSFGFRFGVGVRVDSVSHCLRLTLVAPPNRRVVPYCRTV